MAFDDAAAYDAFMGRFSEPLAAELLSFARAGDVGRALDVGCGTGALVRALVDRWGPGAVAAVDPSPSFVVATRARFPDVAVRTATAESLPFDTNSFDLTLAQLVVHFMSDPVAGLEEMARVTRRGGTLAGCVWDHAGQGGPLAAYWSAVRELDPDTEDESGLPGTAEGDLTRLARQAGWTDVVSGTVEVTVAFATFEEWWQPFTLGVGPAGAHLRSLPETAVERLRGLCALRLPVAPFAIRASAWAVRGVAA